MIKWLFFLCVLGWRAAPGIALSLNVPVPCVVPPGDGLVRLWNYPHHEFHELRYPVDAVDFPDDVQQAFNQALRSPDGVVGEVDPRLLRVIDHLEDHFGAESVEVISGYRSPAYNATLKAKGHNVARESQHMQGTAVDLHLNEVREAAVRDYVQGLGCGGVGYYPANAFVHVDLGPVRTWAEAAARARQFIGERPLLAETARNEYAAGAVIKLRCRASGCQDSRWRVEQFARGAWQPRHSVTWRGMAAQTVAGAPGKYRLATTVGFSNEWYVKR